MKTILKRKQKDSIAGQKSHGDSYNSKGISIDVSSERDRLFEIEKRLQTCEIKLQENAFTIERNTKEMHNKSSNGHVSSEKLLEGNIERQRVNGFKLPRIIPKQYKYKNGIRILDTTPLKNPDKLPGETWAEYYTRHDKCPICHYTNRPDRNWCQC